MAIYVPPIARVIPATVPQKPRDGSLSVTLTLPSSIGADSFQLGEVTITSGPKPAPQKIRVKVSPHLFWLPGCPSPCPTLGGSPRC